MNVDCVHIKGTFKTKLFKAYLNWTSSGFQTIKNQSQTRIDENKNLFYHFFDIEWRGANLQGNLKEISTILACWEIATLTNSFIYKYVVRKMKVKKFLPRILKWESIINIKVLND